MQFSETSLAQLTSFISSPNSVVLLLEPSDVVHDEVGEFVHLAQCIQVRLLHECSSASVLPVIRHLHLVAGDGLDDQSGDVEGEPESEEEGHVPQLLAQVVVAVGFHARLWRSLWRCLRCSRWGWWRWFLVVLVVVDEVVVIEVIRVTRVVMGIEVVN